MFVQKHCFVLFGDILTGQAGSVNMEYLFDLIRMDDLCQFQVE